MFLRWNTPVSGLQTVVFHAVKAMVFAQKMAGFAVHIGYLPHFRRYSPTLYFYFFRKSVHGPGVVMGSHLRLYFT